MNKRRRNMIAGFVGFACIMLIMIGIFEFFAGLTGILKDEIYDEPRDYTFDLGVLGWGIVHMAIGVLLVASGLMMVTGAAWARATGVIVAVLSAVTSFLAIPYYPIWSILVLALDIGVIWALTVHGADVFGEGRSA
jgi:hypothetical protein